MWRTSTPRVTSASAISWRWQRQGHRLGAEDRGGHLARQVHEPSERRAESRGVHVVGVGAEARASPGRVRRVSPAGAPAAQILLVPIIDVLGPKGRGQRPSEVRVPSGGRIAPDVDQAADAVQRGGDPGLWGAVVEWPIVESASYPVVSQEEAPSPLAERQLSRSVY